SAKLKETALPFVIVGDHRCTKPVHSVNVDHVAAASMSVRHLAALGHRRIAYVVGNMAHVFQKEMLQGYRQAVEELGLDDDPRLIIERESILAPSFPSLATESQGPPTTTWQYAQERSLANVQLMKQWLSQVDPLPTAFMTQMFGWASVIS